MWLRRLIGLCALGISLGILIVLFLPITALFFVIAAVLLIIGCKWLFY